MGRILFSNSFNQSEYLRTLAKLGQNTFALRVMNEGELCSYILEHGVNLPTGDFISSKEADYIFYSITKNNFNDAKNLRSAIDSYRDCVIGDISESLENNLTGDFPLKKELIKTNYQAYEQYKKDHQLYDQHDLMNLILNSDIHIDEECFFYEEFGISKLFLEVLNHVFAKVSKLELQDTFNKKEKGIHFLKAYGKPCEADYIFSEIQKYPLDECQIVVVNNGDTQEIVKTAEMLNIPFTSLIGSPIISTKAGVLLSYLLVLEQKSFGVDGYKNLFNCPFFNTDIFKTMIPEDANNPERIYSDFIKYAGWLRLNFNSPVELIHPEIYKNPVHPEMLLKLQQSLSMGRASFIKEFIINPTPMDEMVIDKIKTVEEASIKYGFDIKDVLSDLLNGSINRKVSQSGHLYITNINSALSSLRKYNFIIGLTSDFPGGPKENYLIFDEEYLKTGSNLYLSTEIIKRKERVLKALINASEELYLTYPYFELASLEDKNPSSIMFDLYQGGDISSIPSYGYRDMKLDINKEVYKARLDNLNKNVVPNIINLTYDPNKLLMKKYSPSSFHAFYEEDQYLDFLFSNILGISVDESDDPYVVIPNNELGTLIHSVMEKFQKNKTTLNELLDKANLEFDKFLLKKPPMIEASAVKSRQDYLRLVENLYNMDPGNYHVFSEKYYLGGINEILFGGTADRLERDKFGKYILVDYKTGRNIKHINDDPITCLQGLIYAYLIENYDDKHTVVDHIEFRYPESEVTIKISYNEENKNILLNMIEEFKTAVKSGLLFKNIKKIQDQNYIDKYSHLFSLMKGVKSL